MSERAANVAGGLAGIFAVAAFIVGFGILGGTLPKLGATPDQITRYLHRSSTAVWLGGYIGVLGILAFAVFAARLWAVLRRAEGDPPWLSTLAFAAAIGGLVLSLGADVAVGAAAYYRGRHGGDPAQLAVLFDFKHYGELLFGFLSALFLLATAVVVVTRQALSRWLGWSAAVIALLLLASAATGPGDTSEAPHFLMVIWMVAVSITLLRRRST